MKRVLVITIIALLAMQSCSAKDKNTVSGILEGGLRYLDLDSSRDFTIYRGDYVIFQSKKNLEISVPELEIKESIKAGNKDADYIKFKVSGSFKYTAGDKTGLITVLELVRSNYNEVSAVQGKKIIGNIDPVILDVRTTGEYNSGHIKDALLVPVQELSRKIEDIKQYKEQPVFVYCHSGNRSTVASKMLLDAGFKEIYNLRYGINDWINQGYELTK